jgi:adenylate cyclase
MLVGNMGSCFRFSYGAPGDNVNLSSRLEGFNRMYRTEILVGRTTAELAGNDFVLREVDTVRVKGRKQPLHIYELLGNSGLKLPGQEGQILEFYAAGLDAYYRRHCNEAISLFARCLHILPGDGPPCHGTTLPDLQGFPSARG